MSLNQDIDQSSAGNVAEIVCDVSDNPVAMFSAMVASRPLCGFRKRLQAEILKLVLRGKLWAPYCAVCCGKIVRLTMTNSCLHQFCFSCIHDWSRHRSVRCPLCAAVFTSLLFGIENHIEYKELYVPLRPDDPMLMANEGELGGTLEQFFFVGYVIQPSFDSHYIYI